MTKNIHFPKNKALPRRTLLKGLGIGMALPWLDAMVPAFAGNKRTLNKEIEQTPRRMLGICNNLGLLAEHFFPTEVGRNSQPSTYLKHLDAYRDDFTVLSGVWHPDVDSGHPADNCFLTAAPHPSSGGFRNTISLDQFLAEHVGHLTRFPSLTLGVNVRKGRRSLSWTRAGVLIPCEESAAEIYRQLFVQGSKKQVRQQMRKLELGQSIMDSVAQQIGSLQHDLGPRDRERMDQYTTGVRELEQRMALSREWEQHAKPKSLTTAPLDPENRRAYMEKVRLMYDMASLAFQTDSTRNITLMIDSVSSPVIDVEGIQITDGYHNLSHHGKNPEKLAQLKVIDENHMTLLGDLFGKLKSFPEGDSHLLDRTHIVYGSNLGNASTHVTTNLPVLFAGGGFKHGQHLGFDRENNYPLPNLFVSIIQSMGLDVEKFASSTGTMRGLN